MITSELVMAKQSSITRFVKVSSTSTSVPLPEPVLLLEEVKNNELKENDPESDISDSQETTRNTGGTETLLRSGSDSEYDLDGNNLPQIVNIKKRKTSDRNKYTQKCRDVYKQKFQWLVNKDGSSLCKFCQRTIVGGYSHLLRHETSSSHKKAEKTMKYTVDVRNFQKKTNEQEVLSKKVKECELKLTALIIEHNLPMLLMDHLPKLLVSAASDSKILKGVQCSRTKTTSLLKNFQAESEKQLAAILQQTKFSVIVDETTDLSSHKCLAILVRYVDTNQRKVKDRLCSLVEVQAATAEGILNDILNALQTLEIPLNNLFGFGADNAAVMMGKYQGVQARLKELNPNIFVTGCICHSLHLCSAAAALKLPNEIEDFVRNVYNYLSSSPKRLAEYKEFQEYVRLKPHKLLKPGQTRWLSLEAVVKRTLEQWPALLLFFNSAVLEDNLTAAQTIHDALNNPSYKLYCTFLAYILPIINKLNLEFQAEKPQLHSIYSRIEMTCKTIYKNFLLHDYVDKTPFLAVNVSDPRYYKSLDDLYLGANVEMILRSNKNLTNNEIHNFKLNCLSYYIELCCQMKKRFHNLEQYKCFECLGPTKVLSGNSNIADLFIRFPIENDIELIAQEYREICNLSATVKTELSQLDLEQFWFQIKSIRNVLGESCFQNICLYVFDILCLPHSSACAERIFSALNNVKTKLRNRLLPETCNALLLGKELLENKPCVDWTPSETLLKRKINYDKT